MRNQALFINGIFESVLKEILAVQEHLPEQILFLQPYSASAIVALRDAPPTVDDPVRLFASISEDLPTVRFQAEIVGWTDKRALMDPARTVIQKLLEAFQPNEHGLYDASPSGPSMNLLHIRRLERLTKPFSVERLIKTIDDTPVSPKRSTSGGWSYVRVEPS